MSLCVTTNDGSTEFWRAGTPFPVQKFNRPDTFPIEIGVFAEAEMQHIFDVLNLSKIERRAYFNMHGCISWNDPVAIRGIMAALCRGKS